MKFNLKKRPKNCTVAHGFPGLGLVGTIVTKFLIDHLETEVIGSLKTEELVPLVAIHKAELVDPITLYHNKKYNLLIIQSLSEVAGKEWEVADALTKLSEELNAKETIILEGMPSQQDAVSLYHYSTKSKVIGKSTPLQEGVLGGLTAAMINRGKDLPLTALFVEAHDDIPDTEAAAKIVELMDDYLGMDLSFAPLIDQAKKFEHNLKTVMKQNKESKKDRAVDKQFQETIDYLG